MGKRNSIPLTIERIRERLNYDPDTGILTYRYSKHKPKIGKTVGSVNLEGYLAFNLDGKYVHCQRIAWTHFYGQFPSCQVDHINRIKTDNRISNLRDVTQSQNKQNSLKKSNNTSGYKGVHMVQATGRWRAQLRVGDKRFDLGTYTTPKEAGLAYIAGVKKYCTHHPF